MPELKRAGCLEPRYDYILNIVFLEVFSLKWPSRY